MEIIKHYYEIKNMSEEIIEIIPEIIYKELEKKYFDYYGYGYFCAWGCISEDNTIILIQRDNVKEIRFMMYKESENEDLYEIVIQNKDEFLNLLNQTVFNKSTNYITHYLITDEIDITTEFDDLSDLLPYLKEKDIHSTRIYE